MPAPRPPGRDRRKSRPRWSSRMAVVLGRGQALGPVQQGAARIRCGPARTPTPPRSISSLAASAWCARATCRASGCLRLPPSPAAAAQRGRSGRRPRGARCCPPASRAHAPRGPGSRRGPGERGSGLSAARRGGIQSPPPQSAGQRMSAGVTTDGPARSTRLGWPDDELRGSPGHPGEGEAPLLVAADAQRIRGRSSSRSPGAAAEPASRRPAPFRPCSRRCGS